MNECISLCINSGGDESWAGIASAIAAVTSAFLAYVIFVQAKKFRQATWLSSQNLAWIGYNASSALCEDGGAHEVHKLCNGERFCENVLDQYRTQTYLFQRLNILEIDYFGSVHGYIEHSGLHSVIGEAKAISRDDRNILYIIQFIHVRESYDSEFSAFMFALLCYFRKSRKHGRVARFQGHRILRLKKMCGRRGSRSKITVPLDRLLDKIEALREVADIDTQAPYDVTENAAAVAALDETMDQVWRAMGEPLYDIPESASRNSS